MAGNMMGSPRVRSILKVDNPWLSDGFYNYFNPRRQAQSPSTTGSLRRRVVRKRERQQIRKQIREELN